MIEKMDGVSFSKHSFKRSDQVITLAAKNLKRADETVTYASFKPEFLFQRYVLASQFTEDVSTMFHYELCRYPASLFERPGVMRKTAKANLAEAISKMDGTEAADLPPTANDSNCNVNRVLDGGSLLLRLPWIIGET